MEMESLKIDAAAVTEPALVERVKLVRSQLPVQVGYETLTLAEAQFGLSYTMEELTAKVTACLPVPPWRRRWTIGWTPVSAYRHRLPEKALARLADAVESRLFVSSYQQQSGNLFTTYEAPMAAYHVLTPRLTSAMKPVDPWLVGQVKDTQRYIVLAYWE